MVLIPDHIRIPLVIQFRKCTQGEILQKEQNVLKCVECPEGKYSFSIIFKENYECKICPPEAFKCSGKKVLLKQGFWKF
jgi:hypothetical protein